MRAARAFLTQSLEGWGADDLAWPAAQLVSELATNAVLHARTPFTLQLELTADRLRIAVRDGSPVRPSQRHYGDSATTGRGLALLTSLAGAWGSEADGDGKWVWCELSVGHEDGHGHDEDSTPAAEVTVLEKRPPGVTEGPRANVPGCRAA